MNSVIKKADKNANQLQKHENLLQKHENLRSRSVNTFLVLLLIVGFFFTMGLGKYYVSPAEILNMLISKLSGRPANWDPMAESVVFGLRLPRVLATMFCGAALSMSGATYQGIFKNPLVSPDFLGVTSGACIGAAIGILCGAGSVTIQILAFVGGLAAVALTLLIPYLMRSDSNIMLVLSGIIISGVMGSVLGFIKYIADPEKELAAITYWQMGSFSYIPMAQLLPLLPLMVFSGALLIAMSWWIDVVSLGENEAKSLGADVKAVRYISVLCATLLTASSVCIAGTIGWVGLVVPHFGRMLVGPDNTKLLPCSLLLGAVFMLIVDTVTRVLLYTEMPISILTGIIGAPFYAWLLYKQRMTIR